MADLKVGDTIYERRPGKMAREWMGMFVERTIIGETSRSWLVGPESHPAKAPKKGPHPGFAFSKQEAEDYCYGHASWMIAAEVQRLNDPAILRQIAALIGWTPPESK
jgi:hypothetical protein